jgi:hypothetical protein
VVVGGLVVVGGPVVVVGREAVVRGGAVVATGSAAVVATGDVVTNARSLSSPPAQPGTSAASAAMHVAAAVRRTGDNVSDR